MEPTVRPTSVDLRTAATHTNLYSIHLGWPRFDLEDSAPLSAINSGDRYPQRCPR